MEISNGAVLRKQLHVVLRTTTRTLYKNVLNNFNLFQMVQEIGNSRARAVYEANLPDNFRRPQTDS